MSYIIDIQATEPFDATISETMLKQFAKIALKSQLATAELTLRFVDLNEITHLNNTYRKQNKATNVLSFPTELPENIKQECNFIGDVVICPQVLRQESTDLKKSLIAHYALIVIHGTLHLLGLDHIDDQDAAIMQKLEIDLLASLNFPNPYEDYALD
jgi:probable rRNA maturation factor